MNYVFSVICPIYNMAHYIEGAFKSIKEQTIGFEKNVQIIFINDGSTDKSEEICLNIREQYPDNVLYYKKENGGVSSARNVGIEKAEGKYIVFLDSDDEWDVNAFERAFVFMESHKEEIDACICKMKYLEDEQLEEHPLAFRFHRGNRVADLSVEPECISSTIGNVVVRRRAIGDIRFNEAISSGEDATFTNSILLRKLKVGIVADAVFYYRRNDGRDTTSSSAPWEKSWYFDVPTEFYLGLCQESKKLYGSVTPYIQEVILYDLRWRKFNDVMVNALSKAEKQNHISLMRQVLEQIDDERIANTVGLNQYMRLYLLYLKHGDSLIEELHVQNNELLFKNGLRAFTFRGKKFFVIKTIDISGGNVILQGVALIGILGKDATLFLRDESGKKYDITINRLESLDERGYIGERIVKAFSFYIKVPVCYKRKLRFYAVYDGVESELNPTYDDDTGLERITTSFTTIEGYIVKVLNRKLCFYKKTKRSLLASRWRYKKTVSKKEGGTEIVKNHLFELDLKQRIDNMKLINRAAFVSARSNNGILLPNLSAVFQKCSAKKVVFSRKTPLSNHDLTEGAKLIYKSKVIVTDDYSLFLRKYGKKKGQKVVQIWHAAGAFKKFGQDGSELFLPIDERYHKDYDVVAVSSPSLVDIYAHAFNISSEVVRPLGVPRTDLFFDNEIIEQTREIILAEHPEFMDKEIILYAPTFRNNGSQKKNRFIPKIDFQMLSDTLNDNQLFLICPHPVMENGIVNRPYNNIFVMRDHSTNDYMMIADLLVTDYSSVIFEYSLLDKPMAFFCYDYDLYNRDFYLDYETDLPGPIFRDQTELFDFIQRGSFCIDERQRAFRAKYMSACDGHSAERIAELVDRLCC